MGTRAKRVLIAAVHPLFVRGFVAMLKPDSRFEVSLATENVQQVMDFLLRSSMPDITVLDTDLPNGPVFDIASTVRSQVPESCLVFLFSGFSSARIIQALRCGAVGYLSKHDSADVLHAHLLEISAGRIACSDSYNEFLAYDTEQDTYSLSIDLPLSQLSNRQIEILKHIAEGKTVKEIAKALFLSQKSVDSHKYRLMQKLGIHDRVELTRFAIREGLIEP